MLVTIALVVMMHQTHQVWSVLKAITVSKDQAHPLHALTEHSLIQPRIQSLLTVYNVHQVSGATTKWGGIYDYRKC